MLLVYGLLFGEKLASAFDRHALWIIRVTSGHYPPDVVLACRRQHASRALAAPVSIVVGDVIEGLVTVSLSLLEQFI